MIDKKKGCASMVLEGHEETVWSVAITPDGERVISASWDNTLKVWDLKTRTCSITCKGHKGKINCVTVTPDGKQVVSGSSDNTLKVWDLASGINMLHTILEKNVPVSETSTEFIELLQSNNVLAYENGEPWYEVNPIIQNTVKVYAERQQKK